MNNPIVRAAKRDRATACAMLEPLERRTLFTSGALDPSFAAAGIATVSDLAHGEVHTKASALQPDGKVVLAGTIGGPPSPTGGVVTRLDVDGSPDPSFGGGVVVTLVDPGRYDFLPAAVAVDPSGEILVAGSVTSRGRAYGAVVRLHADGSVDASFGSGGWVNLQFGASGRINALAVDASGRIILGGGDGLASFAFARLKGGGAIDNSFGRHGYAVATFNNPLKAVAFESSVNALATSADGGIVGAGGGDHPEVARLTAHGRLDATFGVGGEAALSNEKGSFHALAVSTDGRIFATGGQALYAEAGTPFLVAAFSATGRLVPTFGRHGVAEETAAPGRSRRVVGEGDGITLTDAGQIIVDGALDRGSVAGVFTEQFNPDGSRDESFGVGGVETFEITAPHGVPAARGVLRDASGDLIVAYDGGVAALAAPLSAPTTVAQFHAARLLADGTLDAAYGAGGFATVAGTAGAGSDDVVDLSASPDGSVFAVVNTGDFGDLVEKFNAYGSVDDGAGIGGRAEVAGAYRVGVAGGSSNGRVVATPDGKLQILSWTALGPAVVHRDNSDLTLDGSFAGDGTRTLGGGGFIGLTALSARPDGSTLAEVITGDDEPASYGGLWVVNATGQITASATRDVVSHYDGHSETVSGSLYQSVATAPDGKTVAVVATYSGQSDVQFTVERYDADLAADPSFGVNGVASLASLPALLDSSAVVAPDGGIYIGGKTGSPSQDVIVHLLADGSIDTAYGPAGYRASPVPSPKLIMQPDGKLLLAAASGTTLTLFRYNADGSPDTTLGVAGQASIDLGGYVRSDAYALETVAGSAKLLVGGTLSQDPPTSTDGTLQYAGPREGFVARIDL